MDDKQLAQLKQMIEAVQEEDYRLDERQKGIVRHMIEYQGLEEREAKIRVLNLGSTPDHMKPVPPSTATYPRMVYHEDGRLKVAADPENYKEAKKNGWTDKPSQVHVDKTLAADIKRAEVPGIKAPAN